MPQWIAVRTNPNADRLAVESVAAIGFEVFCPRTRIRSGAAKWRTVPLFAGYFFARTVNHWQRIERTPGVHSVVKFGLLPARVPDPEIAWLLEQASADGIIRLGSHPARSAPQAAFAAGTPVVVTDGALRGFRALHTGQTNREREIILLELLGASRSVEIAAGLLAVR